ncbi:MAG: NAD-dependent epimerase/dehydratase family protein [Elusimicrobia bacterium]|nr:NAD-dependent epimerase/dehydratase family protein [Elusimicrobiota bacterium]
MRNRTELERGRVLRKYSGKRLLITGGRGYLAANLVDALKNISCAVTLLDTAPPPERRPAAAARIKDVVADLRGLRDWSALLRGTDFVFHLAAQTSAGAADKDPLSDQAVNVLPLLALLETCRKRKFRSAVIFASTVTAAGIPKRLPVDESFREVPPTVYDLHKTIAESYLEYYAAAGAVSGAALRLANVYGPGPKSASADRGILNRMILKALKGWDLPVYGAGSYIRDYVYAGDVAAAFLAAGVKAAGLKGRRFIVGSGKGYSLRQAFRLVSERAALKTGNKARIVRVKPPGGAPAVDKRNFIADTGLFRKSAGWRPLYGLAEGIDATIAYYLGESPALRLLKGKP